ERIGALQRATWLLDFGDDGDRLGSLSDFSLGVGSLWKLRDRDRRFLEFLCPVRRLDGLIASFLKGFRPELVARARFRLCAGFWLWPRLYTGARREVSPDEKCHPDATDDESSRKHDEDEQKAQIVAHHASTHLFRSCGASLVRLIR